MLELRDIRKRFGIEPVLRGLSLSVAEGEFVSLLGPSGCGKTTLLRIVCGIESADGGQVLLDGRDIAAQPASERGFGVVFQSYALFPNLTALENVAYGLQGLQRLGRAERRQRALEMLDLVGLAEQAHKFPAQLSGGQQQRVALARALAPKPRLLLLDEPLSALDAQVRVALRGEIRALQRRLGLTTIMVSHDQEEALAMADRVVLMQGGAIAQLGAPEDLYARPASPFVAGFVGAMNLLPALVVGTGRVRIASEFGDTALGLAADTSAFMTGSPVLVGIRPEAVRLAPFGEELGANMWRGALVDASFRGATSVLRLRCAGLADALEVSWPTAADARLPDWLHGPLALHVPAEAVRLLAVPLSMAAEPATTFVSAEPSAASPAAAWARAA